MSEINNSAAAWTCHAGALTLLCVSALESMSVAAQFALLILSVTLAVLGAELMRAAPVGRSRDETPED